MFLKSKWKANEKSGNSSLRISQNEAKSIRKWKTLTKLMLSAWTTKRNATVLLLSSSQRSSTLTQKAEAHSISGDNESENWRNHSLCNLFTFFPRFRLASICLSSAFLGVPFFCLLYGVPSNVFITSRSANRKSIRLHFRFVYSFRLLPFTFRLCLSVIFFLFSIRLLFSLAFLF